MTIRFVHLHMHTEYSLIDGLVRLKEIGGAVRRAGMPAIAITDQSNLFGLVKFFRQTINQGLKPIVGCDLWLHNPDSPAAPSKLVFLCQNETGYRNLVELISKAYLHGQQFDKPQIMFDWLRLHNNGLIVLSGAQEGVIGQALLANDFERAKKIAGAINKLFPNCFYLELQRVGKKYEENYIQHALTLAEKLELPVVATNDVRFIHAEDYEAHEARVCIHDGFVLEDQKRPRQYTDQQYLKSPEQMIKLFSDIPEALENTVQIAKRCNLYLSFNNVFLPNFSVPKDLTVEDYLKKSAEQGLEKKLEKHVDIQNKSQYQKRLTLELDVINSMGFPGYFLIVADFINWAKENNIPVGPGRGSGAGSLVAYVLGITDLDPIKHDLLFERFLNPERVSMPDFDIDFCMEKRDLVIEYVAEKYGRQNVSQIITYGTMAAKAVVRDVGRVLGYPYGFVDKVAKLIPFEIGMTLKKALRQEQSLLSRYQEEEEVKELIDLAVKLEGIPRNAGKHAGGVVIAPSPLTDYTPLYCEPDGSNLVTQFDKDDVEAVGLVKFDFLGLRTLTIIDWTIQNINQTAAEKFEIHKIAMDDKKTFELLRACQTTAVFQLESSGMKDLIKRLKPDCFEDIIALVALFRPGPLQSGMVDDFINRKHGREKVDYFHPLLEKILKPTYGIILYQEQVMQIAQELSGYTLGSADLLRRAMGKKKPEEMAKQRAIFVDGAIKNNVDGHLANHIFDLIEKFAGYGFNKSHSAAYALIAYQTAYLKAHYPAEFMAAVLSSDMDNTDKVVRFYHDALDLDLNISKPNINDGYYMFTVNHGGIVYGLGAIKGVGQTAIESIVTERKHGMYQNLFEFCQRVDSRKVNRKVLEALARSGALDCFNVDRSTLLASIDTALQAAEQAQRNEELGQNDMFGDAVSTKQITGRYANVSLMPKRELLIGEKATLGIYFSGHPIDEFKYEVDAITSAPISELKLDSNKAIRVAGIVDSIRTVASKRGGRIAFLSLSDHTGHLDVTLFPENYEQYRDLLGSDQVLIVEGKVTVDDYTGNYKINAEIVYDLNQARAKFARAIKLKIRKETADKNILNTLRQSLAGHIPGGCSVVINYQTFQAATDILLGEDWRVNVSTDLLAKLNQLLGKEAVEIIYN